MGKLRVLSPRGDDEKEWLRQDAVSVEVARALFLEHQRNGFAAFAKVNGGHELIKSFDPDAEEILIVGPLAGG